MDKEEVRKALDEATPGPWGWSQSMTQCPLGECHQISLWHMGDEEMELTLDDYKLAANAPTWLRELLAENDRKDREIESLRAERDYNRELYEAQCEATKVVQRERDEARQERDETAKAAWGVVTDNVQLRKANAAPLECARHYASDGYWLHDMNGQERIYVGEVGPKFAVDTLTQYDTAQPTAQCKHGDSYSKCADCQAEDYVMKMHRGEDKSE